MRNFTLAFLLSCTLIFTFSGLQAQDPSWFTDVSASVGLATTPQALRLNVVDINGDKYPDIVSTRTVNQRDWSTFI